MTHERFGIAIALAATWLLTLPSEARCEEKLKPLILTYGSVIGADVLVTEIAIERGLKEMNPLFRHRPIRLAGSAAVVVGCAYVTREVSKEHPKAAKWAKRAIIGIRLAFVVKNVQTVRGAR